MESIEHIKIRQIEDPIPLTKDDILWYAERLGKMENQNQIRHSVEDHGDHLHVVIVEEGDQS